MAESVPPSPVLEPGTVLDRYELLCTIARGGMAHVWLGRFKGKHGFEKLVAIKTILPEHALDPRFRNMFLDEARIASGIDHPNVAKLMDLGEWRECLYLVMEYVDGDSLSRLNRSMAKRKVELPVPIALRVLADACAGMHAAHELRGDDGALLGVVHRDVSPQNLLIPVNGVSKLIDFGVAKARHRLGEETSAGFAKGKSRYMSPEQALAKPVDRRADLFALGAIAYELFEGQTPYDGPNDMARLHALIAGDEIRALPHAPHASVEKLVLKALAREPDARFATSGEMRDAIEDAMVSLKVRATADDVAAFVVQQTADRITERTRVVRLAVDAASERQRIKDMVEHGSPDIGGESAPPRAYSASVANHSIPPQKRSWPVAALAALLVGSVFVVAIVLRDRGTPAIPRVDRAVPPVAQPVTVATSPVASDPSVTFSVADAPVRHDPPALVKPRAPVTLGASAASTSTSRHAKNPRDVVIQ